MNCAGNETKRNERIGERRGKPCVGKRRPQSEIKNDGEKKRKGRPTTKYRTQILRIRRIRPKPNKTALFTQNNTIYYLDCNKFGKQHSIPGKCHNGNWTAAVPAIALPENKKRTERWIPRKLNECESIKHEYPNQNSRRNETKISEG